jgi:hypothetical protein
MILRLMRDNLETLRESKDPAEQDKLMKVNNFLNERKKEVFAKTGTVIRK